MVSTKYGQFQKSKKNFHNRKQSIQDSDNNRSVQNNEIKRVGREQNYNENHEKPRPSSWAKFSLSSKLIDNRIRDPKQRKFKPTRKDRSQGFRAKKLKPYNPSSNAQICSTIKEYIKLLEKSNDLKKNSKSSNNEKNKVAAIYSIVTSLRQLGKEEFKKVIDENAFNESELDEIDNICVKFAPELANVITQYKGKRTSSVRVSVEREKWFKSINDQNKDITSSMSKLSYNNESIGNTQMMDITNFSSDGYWNPALKTRVKKLKMIAMKHSKSHSEERALVENRVSKCLLSINKNKMLNSQAITDGFENNEINTRNFLHIDSKIGNSKTWADNANSSKIINNEIKRYVDLVPNEDSFNYNKHHYKMKRKGDHITSPTNTFKGIQRIDLIDSKLEKKWSKFAFTSISQTSSDVNSDLVQQFHIAVSDLQKIIDKWTQEKGEQRTKAVSLLRRVIKNKKYSMNAEIQNMIKNCGILEISNL